MGYIRNQNDYGKKTGGFCLGGRRYMHWIIVVKKWRRITQTLANQPYAGVIVLLCWRFIVRLVQRMGSLFAAQALTILMEYFRFCILRCMAGLAFSLIAFCWRRLFPTPSIIKWPTKEKPAGNCSVFVACFIACLAGLSGANQRTLIMWTTFAVALPA